MQTLHQCALGATRPPGKRSRAIVLALLLSFFAAISFLPGSLLAAKIRGKVAGVRGEPLARVQVSILQTQQQTITGDDGGFAIADLAPGDYTLQGRW